MFRVCVDGGAHTVSQTLSHGSQTVVRTVLGRIEKIQGFYPMTQLGFRKEAGTRVAILTSRKVIE